MGGEISFPKRLRRSAWRLVLLGTFTLGSYGVLHALKPTERFTLAQLEAEPKMTPGQFADLFEDFAFDFYPYIQAPAEFLENRSGDCDDYAALAGHVLGRQGYRTRLVQVRLVGTNVDHAVCYVDDKRAYLDYNNRKYSFNLEKSRPFLRDIAEKVADSLERNWSAAFEFSYSYAERQKRTRVVVVKTDDPARDPDRQPATQPR